MTDAPPVTTAGRLQADRPVPAVGWECVGVSVRRGGSEVLSDVTLRVPAGQCLCIIGPNGSGKTTLMLTMLGLLSPHRGQVLVNGAPLARLSPRQRGRLAAYVPQAVERLPAFRVYDVVAGGRYPHAHPLRPLSATDQQVIAATLARCGLTSLAERPVSAVSGGERQKTLLAAAVAQQAAWLFLDEPSTALDPAVQLELVALLREWHAGGGGLALISHDLQLPAALGGRVVALRAGRVAADGPAAELLQPHTLGAIYDAEFETAVTAGGRQVVLPRWW